MGPSREVFRVHKLASMEAHPIDQLLDAWRADELKKPRCQCAAAAQFDSVLRNLTRHMSR